MSTRNKNYADLLTHRFYSALYNPPTVSPKLLSTPSSRRDPNVNPVNCDGKCIQAKVTSFSARFCITKEESPGEICSVIDASTFYDETETSDCIGESQWEEFGILGTGYMLDGSPYREFELDATYVDGCVVMSGSSYIQRVSGNCDLCNVGGTCVSSETKNITQQHRVCRRTYPGLNTDAPQFPPVTNLVQDYYDPNLGVGTLWVFREMIRTAINNGLFSFTHSADCTCDKENPVIPPVAGIVMPTQPSTASGRTITTLGQGRNTSRSTSSQSPPSSSPPSSSPPSSSPPSTGGGY